MWIIFRWTFVPWKSQYVDSKFRITHWSMRAHGSAADTRTHYYVQQRWHSAGSAKRFRHYILGLLFSAFLILDSNELEIDYLTGNSGALVSNRQNTVHLAQNTTTTSFCWSNNSVIPDIQHTACKKRSFWRTKLRITVCAHTVCYHTGGSMKLNACILILAHMVYL